MPTLPVGSSVASGTNDVTKGQFPAPRRSVVIEFSGLSGNERAVSSAAGDDGSTPGGGFCGQRSGSEVKWRRRQ